jgi:hypothetical protein
MRQAGRWRLQPGMTGGEKIKNLELTAVNIKDRQLTGREGVRPLETSSPSLGFFLVEVKMKDKLLHPVEFKGKRHRKSRWQGCRKVRIISPNERK